MYRCVKFGFLCISELTAWLPAVAVSAASSVTMARKSIPNIEPLPNVPPMANLGQTQTSVSSSICSLAANTLHTHTSMATSTVCSTSITASHLASTSRMVEVVVVDSPNNTSGTQQADGTTENLTTKPEYKLTEIVSQEKGQLFQSQSENGLELEPPRTDVYTVRRRSRQFFTLREEEENATDNQLIDNCKWKVITLNTLKFN